MKWKNEFRLNVRYGFAGILNGLVSGGAIWFSTMLGLPPILVNLIGFLVGIVFAFLFSRRFVFRSKGHFTTEAIRYFLSFFISYSINILVLQLSILEFKLGHLLSQGIAVSSYIVTMYLAARFYIFRRIKD